MRRFLQWSGCRTKMCTIPMIELLVDFVPAVSDYGSHLLAVPSAGGWPFQWVPMVERLSK